MADVVLQYYDRVLVHTDVQLFEFGLTFPEVARIEDRLAYTGFVSSFDRPRAVPDGQSTASDNDSGTPDVRKHGSREVVVSAGGGAVGAPLLLAAIAASALDGAHRPWRVLIGAALPAGERQHVERAAIKARKAGARVTVENNRKDFRQLLEQACVSVSQAGYNTIIDVLSTRSAAVLVPFAAGGEREQTVRASRLAQLGLACVVEQCSLDPERLLRAVNEAQALPAVGLSQIAMDGAQTSARLILEMASGASNERGSFGE